MGSSESKEFVDAVNHPPLFYEGIEFVKTGSLTNAELSFQQALKAHPGRAFWDGLVSATFRKQTDDTLSKADTHGTPTSPGKTDASVFDDPDAPKMAALVDKKSADDVVFFRQRPVFLPLDGRLLDIVDYLRLATDVAQAYVKYTDTPKMREVATMHNGMVASYTQLLQHFLRLYRYEQQPGCSSGTSTATEQVNEQGLPVRRINFTRNPTTVEEAIQQKLNLRNLRNSSLAGDRELEIVFVNLEHIVYYYWVSATQNYNVLALQQCAALTAKEDEAKKQRIMSRIMENCAALQDSLQWMSMHYPDQFGARVLRKVLGLSEEGADGIRGMVGTAESNAAPSTGSGQNLSSHHKGSSTHSKEFRYCCCGSILSGGAQQMNLLCLSHNFNLAQPLQLPLNNVLPVKLIVDTTVSKSDIPTLPPPTKRCPYTYMSWYSALSMYPVPGSSDNYLEASLPNYVGDGVAGHLTVIGTAEAVDGRPHIPGVEYVLIPDEHTDKAAKKAYLKTLEDCISPHGNAKLDLTDIQCLGAVCIEEVILLLAPILLFSSYMATSVGFDAEAQQGLCDKLCAVLKELYGDADVMSQFFSELWFATKKGKIRFEVEQ